MRSCPQRCSPLGQPAQWSLLLGVLVFFLFTVPSFVKEPNTKPSRYQDLEIDKRFSGSQEVISQTSTAGTGPNAGGQLLQKKPSQSTALDAKGLSTRGAREASPGKLDRVTPTAQTGAPEKPTLRTRAQRKPTAMADTLTQQNQDVLRTSGERHQHEQPMTPLATSRKQQDRGDRGVGTAKKLTPKPQDKGQTPSPQLRGVSLSMRSRQGAATTATVQRKRPLEGVQTQTKPKPKVRPQGSTPSPRPSKQNAPELKAVNFKSEPWWDFEENYSFEVGALQSTCPDSVKVKAARSPWFGPRFLPNLTLFLDSGRFNLSEWRRLEHFAPPFGFMELNFSLVQSVVTRFPPVPQQQLLLADLPAGQPRCISCAVVGNGGILNNSRVGRDIDAHDYVFRLSGAITKGYEEDVGTRTSFYGFTAFSLTQSLYQLGSRGFRHVPLGQNIRYLHFLEHTRDYQWLAALLRNQTLMEKNLFWFRRRPQEVFREALRLDQYLLLHPDLLRYMKNRFLRSGTLDTKRWRIYRPTTGALLLLTALQLCDRVSAYGFITEGHQRFSDHYYDKSWKKLVFYINHDFKLELALWKRLHDQGIIWLYQRPEPPK